MNKIDLTDRVAIITGGAQGIGLAIAERLIASGAKVAIWDRNPDMAETTAVNLRNNGDAAAFECDVSSPVSVAAALAATQKHYGTVSILVNSAGITGPNETVENYPDDAWEQVMSVNLTGTYLMNKAVIPGMKAQNYGRIVNIASVAGKEGNPTAGAYSASKAGVIALTKTLGKELAAFDIGVNCVTPSAARTAIFDQMTQEHIDYMLSKIPRARFVKVEEIAAMVAWLVSQDNSYTTAGVFDLSGGRATY